MVAKVQLGETKDKDVTYQIQCNCNGKESLQDAEV
jgi:hypothetical protein